MSAPTDDPSYWDSPIASTSRRGHSRQSSTSSIPAYTKINTGRRGSIKDPEALQAAIERTKNARKRRTNSTASAVPPSEDDLDDTTALHQRQEDARLIRCDAEQQRRNELGKGYDRLRNALNRGDERLSKARVVERATARVVQLRDQNTRMEEELTRKQELIKELNRANEQLMLEASGAAPLLASSPHSASSPSSGRPGSSSHTSVSYGVQAGPSHDRSSSLPTPPHTYTGLQHQDPEFMPTMYKQEPFAYSYDAEPQLYPPADFYASQPAPPVIGINPLQPRSESPRYESGAPFGLGQADERDLAGHWLPGDGGASQWNASSGLPGTYATYPSSSPNREALGELSEVPANGYPPW